MKTISEEVTVSNQQELETTKQEKNKAKDMKKESNTTAKPKRDITVDLIRIVACLIVIATHASLQVYNVYDVQVDWSRLFQKCFLTDAVPLFFMITGFFLVNGRSYKKIWKSTAVKILLPSFIFVLFTQAFRLFLINKESFSYCLQNLDFNISGILECILKADITYLNGIGDHLWYVFAYVRVVIWIPVLWLVCKEEKTSKLARRILLGLALLDLLLTDIQRFVTLPIGEINIYNIIGNEILYVLLGYELFVNKDKIRKNKKVCLISLVVFCIINVIRYKVEMEYMIINHFTDILGRENFLDWSYTFFNVISAMSLFMFLYSFEIKNETLSKIILWISDKTFGIYLIHYIILVKVDLYKFEKIGKVVFELIYLASAVIITFVVSLIIVALLKKITEIILKLPRNVKNSLATRK